MKFYLQRKILHQLFLQKREDKGGTEKKTLFKSIWKRNDKKVQKIRLFLCTIIYDTLTDVNITHYVFISNIIYEYYLGKYNML